MTDLASLTDVVNRWRPLTAAEQTVAAALLGDASAIVRANFPGVDADVASGAVSAATAAGVVAGMVKRAMMHADGVKSEGVGPYSVSYDNALGSLFLTAADRVLIGGVPVRAKSVRFG